MMNWLIQRGFKCVKIMRAKEDDKLVIFGFEETEALLEAVQEYKTEGYLSSDSYQFFDKLRRMDGNGETNTTL